MKSEMTGVDFKAIIKDFNIKEGEFVAVPFGSGHINDTFKITLKDSGDYLLQKINHFVFKDVDGLMQNMGYVTEHIKAKNVEWGTPNKKVLTLIGCKSGKQYTIDADGNYWRMTNFLHNTKSYDIVTTTKQAQQGGIAFGNFQRMLCDMSPNKLVETIPNFLNIAWRLENFKKAIVDNKAGRAGAVSSEIEFLLSRESEMTALYQMAQAGLLPVRITHNDTKFNNILLNNDDEIQCVIDLDTVMPGYVAHDFGDAIRTIINTAAEDEADLNAINLDISLFKAFVNGYLSEVKSFLTDAELGSLVKGVLLMTYMQAMRFLTDYIDGDLYYKTGFKEHNLQRTHAQMHLLKKLEEQKPLLEQIVQNEWSAQHADLISVDNINTV